MAEKNHRGTKEAGGALEVEPVATFTPATAKFVYGPSNQKVTFVIGAGSIAQEIEATTDDEGDAMAQFVPPAPGTPDGPGGAEHRPRSAGYHRRGNRTLKGENRNGKQRMGP